MTVLQARQPATPIPYKPTTWAFAAGPRRVHVWSPAGGAPPRFVLGIVHGLGDHGGRFAGLGRCIAAQGAAVVAFDQRGHGESPGRRMVIPSYSALLDDVGELLRLLRERWPGVPAGLLGQSMGGNLVINHALRRQPVADFVIAGSPMLRAVQQPTPGRRRVLKAIAWLAPNFTLATPTDPKTLSRDPEAQRRYTSDPLVQQRISLRLASVLVESGEWAMANAHRLATPLLIAHGADDQLTSPEASEQFATAAGDRAEMLLWPAGRHDLHHDTDRAAYQAQLSEWIEQRIGSAAGESPLRTAA